jgi:hypothetical protein
MVNVLLPFKINFPPFGGKSTNQKKSLFGSSDSTFVKIFVPGLGL